MLTEAPEAMLVAFVGLVSHTIDGHIRSKAYKSCEYEGVVNINPPVQCTLGNQPRQDRQGRSY